MFDHCGARTSHRADQAPKPVTAVLLSKPGLKERKNKKTTLSQRALDKFGFIEAWAKLSNRFAVSPTHSWAKFSNRFAVNPTDSWTKLLERLFRQASTPTSEI
jgi:hypothetical protein